MIRKEELRIGSLVLDNGNPFKIRFGEDINDYDDFEPIPITEERLLSFGFKPLGDNTYYKYGALVGFQLFYNDEIWILTLIQNKNQIGMDTVQFVHQFENLYISLNAEELQNESK